jgi:hypothetical protein
MRLPAATLVRLSSSLAGRTFQRLDN